MGRHLVLPIVLASLVSLSTSSVCTDKRQSLAADSTKNALEELAGSSNSETIFEKLIEFANASFSCFDHDGSQMDECLKCLTVNDLIDMPEGSGTLQSIAIFFLWYSIDQTEFCEVLEEGQISTETVWDGLLKIMNEGDHGEENGHDDDHSEENEDDHAHEEEHEDDHGHEEDSDEEHDSHVKVTLAMIQPIINRFSNVVNTENCTIFFNAADVINPYSTSDVDDGVEQENFGDVALDIVQRFYSGQCYDETEVKYNLIDFTYSLFDPYADSNCEIGTEELERMAADLNIGVADEEEEDDDHSGHNHKRKKRSLDDGVSVIAECVNIDKIQEATGREIYTVDDFSLIAPILLQQTAQGCPLARESASSESMISSAEKYGYGTISILIISLLSLIGVLIYPCRTQATYAYLMSGMLGVAIGSLTGDAFLHLIPHGIGLHAHGEDDHNHSEDEGLEIEPYVWKMLCVCISIWLFYILQLCVMARLDIVFKNRCAPNDATSISADQLENDTANSKPDINESREDSGVAWMILIGDAVHNFADGLVVGAAFSVSWQTGLSTSIAVAIHELPHEFGDVAILLQVDWSVKSIIIGQLASALTAFIGLYIGIGVAAVEGTTEWIFVIAAGMFLYVALADVIPELQEAFKLRRPLGTFIASNIGILVGFIALFLLAIYEEHIEI